MVAKALPCYGLRHTEIAELLDQGSDRIRDSPRSVNCRVPIPCSVYRHICFTGLYLTERRVSPFVFLCAKGECSPAFI